MWNTNMPCCYYYGSVQANHIFQCRVFIAFRNPLPLLAVGHVRCTQAISNGIKLERQDSFHQPVQSLAQGKHA